MNIALPLVSPVIFAVRSAAASLRSRFKNHAQPADLKFTDTVERELNDREARRYWS